MSTIVVLGGYGIFGRRVAETLAHDRDHEVFVCGRDLDKATRAAKEIGGSAKAIAFDCHRGDLARELSRLGASVVVHTAGPFQSQDYAVARACIDARAHYIDLADARAFVNGIGALNRRAERNGVLVVSGASSVPALSAAVLDKLRVAFSRIDTIECAITSGARPPGEATLRGTLAYAGKPFSVWHDNQWRVAHGWHGLQLKRYRDLGLRLIAQCEVPDLDLFPIRYAAHTVSFRAGTAFKFQMMTIWLASWLIRMKVLHSIDRHLSRMHRIASRLAEYGSKSSAMHVQVSGLDHDNRPISKTWYLVAKQDHGPFIPTFPSIALTRKILRGEVRERGAMPCMGLLTLEEILGVGSELDLQTFDL
jgi:hypothetical protein